MKNLLMLILVLVSNMTLAQKIGDAYAVMMSQITPTQIFCHSNYYEVEEVTDSVIRYYNVSNLNKIVFGIDYVYPTENALETALKSFIIDAKVIGYNLWVKGDSIIIKQNTDLIMIRDASIIRIEGISDANKKE